MICGIFLIIRMLSETSHQLISRDGKDIMLINYTIRYGSFKGIYIYFNIPENIYIHFKDA